MKDYQGFDDMYDVDENPCSAYENCEHREKCDELGYCLVYCEGEEE